MIPGVVGVVPNMEGVVHSMVGRWANRTHHSQRSWGGSQCTGCVSLRIAHGGLGSSVNQRSVHRFPEHFDVNVAGLDASAGLLRETRGRHCVLFLGGGFSMAARLPSLQKLFEAVAGKYSRRLGEGVQSLIKFPDYEMAAKTEEDDLLQHWKADAVDQVMKQCLEQSPDPALTFYGAISGGIRQMKKFG